MARTVSSVAATRSTSLGAVRTAALLAAFFGLLLVWGVGFAAPGALHNATHDTRHAVAVPCH